MSNSVGISFVSTLVTNPITLGSDGYANTVTVTSTGTISAPQITTGVGFQVTIGGNDTTLINDGVIRGGAADRHSIPGDGVTLASGYLMNAGAIYGGSRVYYAGGTGIVQTGGTLVNTGLISGGSSVGYGILQLGLNMYGGYVDNEGRIIGGTNVDGGIFVNASYISGIGLSAGLFTNNGSVLSVGAYGGTLTNHGYINLVRILGGTVINNGSLMGVDIGQVNSTLGGVLVNTGTITGINSKGIGVYVTDPGTVFNSGFIIGGLVADAGALDLVLAPSSTITDNVSANRNFSNQLELTSAATAGSLNMAGSFTGFSTIAFDAGAAWTLAGTAAELAAGQKIAGFGLGDTLVLEGVSGTSATFVPGTGLELGSNTIDLIGSFTKTDFTVTTDGTNTTITAPCFCAGTRIRTPGGDIPVENLRIGDEVCTAFRGTQRIKWIGQRRYDGRFIAGNLNALPICLKAGAIADGVPSRELWVSPDHAICEGGVLIHARRLVNGVTIVQVEAVAHVEYRHIELEGHHIIFAEGCPTESFLDTHCRERFANAHEYAALYGDGMPGDFCLPLVQGGFHLENIRRRLAERAGVPPSILAPGPLHGNLDEAGPERLRGWAQDILAPEVPVLFTVLADGKPFGVVLANEFRDDLRAAGLGSGCHAFSAVFPPGARQVEVRRASDGAVLTQAPLTQAA